MHIYISGPISDMPNGNKEAFYQAEEDIKKNILPCTVANPHTICRNLPEGSAWILYMIPCLRALRGCSAIYMLEGWEKSDGARIELEFASALGLDIFYQGGLKELSNAS